MPIYEYKCKKCGVKFESYRGISDNDTMVKCPKCGSSNPYRIFSPFFSKNSFGSSCGPSFPT